MALFGGNNLSKEKVSKALQAVREPDQGKDIVSLGMVRDVGVNGGDITLVLSAPSPGYGHRAALEASVRQALAKLDGFKGVQIHWSVPVPQSRGADGKVPVEGVKNLIAVASGKGGVGKTTVAVNLALALGQTGAKVGLLDADVYGPNVPTMLNIEGQPLATGEQIIPHETRGIKVMSMGFLNPGDKPLIWRGPMLHQVIQQFIRRVVWGELDYLIIDLPPGTGDVQLSLVQTVPLTGAVLVTTPSVVALADVRKAIEMFRQIRTPILGVVENMSYFLCPHCGERTEIFSYGEGKTTADHFGVPFLGEIPLNAGIRLHCDTGKPPVLLGEDVPEALPFYEVARRMTANLEAVAAGEEATPVIQIE